LAKEAAILQQQIARARQQKDDSEAEAAEWRARMIQRAETAEGLAEAERARREAVENQQRQERLLQSRTAEAQAERLQETAEALAASRQIEQSTAAREAEALAAVQEARNEGRRASERLAELMERDSAEKSMIQMRLLALLVETSSAVQTASECYEDGTNLVREFQTQLDMSATKVVLFLCLNCSNFWINFLG
jgi:hypothetical protein